MEAELITNGLLAIIAGLGGLCTWFMSRMVTKFDQLETCVEQLSIDLAVFKVKIAAIFNLTEDLDEIPAPRRK